MEQETNSEIISILKDLQTRMINIEKRMGELAGQVKKRPTGVRHDSPSSRTYGGQQRYKDGRTNSYAAKNARTIRPYGKKQNDALKRAPKKNVAYNPGK